MIVFEKLVEKNDQPINNMSEELVTFFKQMLRK